VAVLGARAWLPPDKGGASGRRGLGDEGTRGVVSAVAAWAIVRAEPTPEKDAVPAEEVSRATEEAPPAEASLPAKSSSSLAESRAEPSRTMAVGARRVASTRYKGRSAGPAGPTATAGAEQPLPGAAPAAE
jgi:hypothetical protein